MSAASGLYRRVAQVLDPNTLLLSDPLPAGSYAVSIASGFVNETFSGNTVDARGSSTASPFVLVGNHYGTQLTGNTTYGGGEAIRVVAYPTEAPQLWGWSHDPFLGGTIILVAGTLIVGQGSSLINIGGGPWWAYLGGLCGAVLVFGTLIAAPKVGVLPTFIAVVLGQVVLAAAIDYFGWFGQPVASFGWDRILAIILLLASLALLLRRV